MKSRFFDLLQFQLFHTVLQLLGRDGQLVCCGVQTVSLPQRLRDDSRLILGQQLSQVHLAPA